MWVRSVLGCAVSIAIAVSSSAQAGSQQSALTLRPHTFTAADGSTTNAELGTFDVPEHRAAPSSRRIEISFVRFRSTAAVPGPPIVYLAGGPGVSGIATAQGRRYPLFQALRSVADVIVLDQRGTGPSAANLRCPQTLDYPLDRPGAREILLERFIEKSAECVRSLRLQGVDISGYNTNENADDLDELRQRLGAPAISLLGTSYGTHLALAAIRRHPSRVHRAVLVGVEGVDATLKRPSTIQRSLQMVSDLAKLESGRSIEEPDLMTLLADVLKALEREPLAVQLPATGTAAARTVVLGRFDVQWTTSAFIVGSQGVFTLPSLYRALAARDGSHPEVQRMASAVAASRTGSIGSAMPIMMDCFSGVSTERWTRILKEEPTTLLGRLIDFPFPEICDGWGRPDLGDEFRGAVASTVPVLFVSGSLDARTPPFAAHEIGTRFPNGSHLVIDGATHGDPLFLSSPVIQTHIFEFLRGAPVASGRVAGSIPRFLK
jgi:pimeloyl-ACP methyl ester carboxylesterase